MSKNYSICSTNQRFALRSSRKLTKLIRRKDLCHPSSIFLIVALEKHNVMKSIVVPIDFSPSSDNAARYAADLALAIKADLHLIHVIQAPVTAAELTMTEDPWQIPSQACSDRVRWRASLPWSSSEPLSSRARAMHTSRCW